ncbi:MFS family permease [Peribacillus deserti]|uniref:MFS family permease n=1 Tax=Peribacillus deserti TaxID=673318 RepID=A0ABS2QFV5_9BACI|nr:MFS transporter [Peribacillus deserti]MBM7692043.1 MFS family permease [Peribacillus deserti]
MSQSTTNPAMEAKQSGPHFIIISILTLFSFGPQYFTNLSYILNQMIIQNGLKLSTHDMLLPSIASNLAFALGVPLGRILSMKFGIRKIYLTFIGIFIGGTLINIFSFGLYTLTIGRTIQGIGAGVLFLTILPLSLRSYPNKVRNYFILFAIGGLFGSSAVGAFFGSLSLSTSEWRWLFLLNILTSLICFWLGYTVLPQQKPEEKVSLKFDVKGVFLFALLLIVLIFPLFNLQEKGFSSIHVWPYLALAFILLVIFVAVDFTAENPLIPVRSLWAAKPISGTIMALAAHVALIIAIAGINGFLRTIMDPPFGSLTIFYFWFFIGIIVSALICTLLYDKLGAGILGIIGSITIILVSIQWRMVGPEAHLSMLSFQMACVGGGVSMVLISGALGTALAGDIHQATARSASLHSIRNFIGAVAAPVLGWFVLRMNAMHYEDIRGKTSLLDPELYSETAALVRKLMNSGHTFTEAKSLASYTIAVNAQKGAVLGAYHDLFSILLILGIIMLLASIGKALTGKGRSLVQKEKRILLQAPPKGKNKNEMILSNQN